MLCSGEDHEIIQPMKEYTKNPPTVRSFDHILERPFSEILMIALYFTKNPELENKIVDLIERFSRQKKELCQHLENI